MSLKHRHEEIFGNAGCCVSSWNASSSLFFLTQQINRASISFLCCQHWSISCTKCPSKFWVWKSLCNIFISLNQKSVCRHVFSRWIWPNFFCLLFILKEANGASSYTRFRVRLDTWLEHRVLKVANIMLGSNKRNVRINMKIDTRQSDASALLISHKIPTGILSSVLGIAL